ncbi:MAG: hypothetical protein R3B84_00155 [Zavarzinella sp.]
MLHAQEVTLVSVPTADWLKKELKFQDNKYTYNITTENTSKLQLLLNKDRFLPISLYNTLAESRNARIKEVLPFCEFWAKELKVDLLTELATFASKDSDRVLIAKHTINVIHDIRKRQEKYMPASKAGRFTNLFSTNTTVEQLYKNDRLDTFFAHDYVRSPSGKHIKIFSLPCDLLKANMFAGSVIFSNPQHVITPFSLHSSVVVANNNFILIQAIDTITIVDGDLDLGIAAHPKSTINSTLIVNGSITSIVGPPVSTFAFATGDYKIRLSDSVFNQLHDTVLLAKGTSLQTSVEDFRAAGIICKENLLDNPLGVKFFELSEVGLKVAVKDEKVTIAELSKDSFLAKAFRTGDVIRKINGLKMTSEHDVRRQMRSTVVWDAGIFEVERDGKTQHYLVKPNFFPLDKK